MAKNLEGELEVAIGNLRKERADLLGRVAQIDASFARLGIKLDAIAAAPASAPVATGKRRGRPPAAASVAAPAKKGKKRGPKPKAEKAAANAKPGKRSGKRSTYGITATDFVLAFVKSHGSPSTAEVNEHWTKEGRNGKADNTLGALVKSGQIKRQTVEGESRSRYVIA